MLNPILLAHRISIVGKIFLLTLINHPQLETTNQPSMMQRRITTCSAPVSSPYAAAAPWHLMRTKDPRDNFLDMAGWPCSSYLVSCKYDMNVDMKWQLIQPVYPKYYLLLNLSRGCCGIPCRLGWYQWLYWFAFRGSAAEWKASCAEWILIFFVTWTGGLLIASSSDVESASKMAWVWPLWNTVFINMPG